MSHFRVMMRKNAITWRRTIVGSFVEVCCPIVLMLILVYLKCTSELRHPPVLLRPRLAYPVADFNITSGQWQRSDSRELGNQLLPWLEFIDYYSLQETSEGVFYDPKIDEKSPLFWNIKEAQKSDDGFHNIIGFLRNDNPIMEDVLAQLNLLMEEQK